MRSDPGRVALPRSAQVVEIAPVRGWQVRHAGDHLLTAVVVIVVVVVPALTGRGLVLRDEGDRARHGDERQPRVLGPLRPRLAREPEPDVRAGRAEDERSAESGELGD